MFYLPCCNLAPHHDAANAADDDEDDDDDDGWSRRGSGCRAVHKECKVTSRKTTVVPSVLFPRLPVALQPGRRLRVWSPMWQCLLLPLLLAKRDALDLSLAWPGRHSSSLPEQLQSVNNFKCGAFFASWRSWPTLRSDPLRDPLSLSLSHRIHINHS